MSDIELRQLTKRFGAFVAVHGIDLSANKGEMLTLLGPSGCGKTTTLRMIAGLEDPDGGIIRAGSRTMYDFAKGINVPSENRGLGMVFQSYAIWPHMTVAENVAYPLRMRKVPKAKSAELVRRVLEMVGLAGYETKPATKLSGGQQQRVAFARALVFEPELLLLDEPLSNLDAKLREHMRFELKAMKRNLGLTSIYVTHDQEEALTLSDRVVVMNGGRIDQVGTPEEIYERPATRFVAEFIGKANMIELHDAVEIRGREAAVTVQTQGGPVLIVLDEECFRTGDTGKAAIPAGKLGSAHLFVRPEKVSICGGERRDGVTLFPGKVKEKAYIGDRNEYLVDVGDNATFRVNAPAGAPWTIGEGVHLGVADRDFVLYA